MTDTQRTRLTPIQLEELRGKFGYLPHDYFDYMTTIGWGETKSGKMIYGGPTDVVDIFGPTCKLPDVVLLGDDFQGYCFGFDASSARYGEVSDAGVWEEWSSERGIADYVDDRAS